MNRNNTSGYKGDSLHKGTVKWLAFIWENRKKIHIGLYVTIEEAVLARKLYSERLFGGFMNE